MKQSYFLTVLTACALCFLAFVYGAVAMQMRWWPSNYIYQAGNAAVALLATVQEEVVNDWPTSMEFFETRGFTGITTEWRVDNPPADDSLIFVDGGVAQLRSHCPDNGCLAWLMERDGTVRHVWDIGPELIWHDLQTIEGFSRAENIYSVGSLPLANGDLLVTYQGRNTYPYGVGMARFDKDSNLLWKKENLAHHWFTLGADGRIYVPAFEGVDAPYPVGETNLQIGCNAEQLQQDVILVLSPDGEELERISVIDVLAESDYAGIVFQAIHSDRGIPLSYNECDPTHLNDVRYISAEQAATSAHLQAGDLLISLRSNNAVLTLNPETRQVTWASVGRTLLQHSPRYMDDNTVLVLDNLGGTTAQGGTRIVRIDMDTDESKVVFPRPRQAALTNILTHNGGFLDVSSDRQRALVSLTRRGRTVEIDLKTGRILWDFFNTHDVSDLVDAPEGQTHARFATQTVRYFPDPTFTLNEGRLKE